MKKLFSLIFAFTLVFALPAQDPPNLLPHTPPAELPRSVEYGVFGLIVLGAFWQLRQMNSELTGDVKKAIENNTAALTDFRQVLIRFENRMDKLEDQVRNTAK